MKDVIIYNNEPRVELIYTWDPPTPAVSTLGKIHLIQAGWLVGGLADCTIFNNSMFWPFLATMWLTSLKALIF